MALARVKALNAIRMGSSLMLLGASASMSFMARLGPRLPRLLDARHINAGEDDWLQSCTGRSTAFDLRNW